jgi:hypothetical protein
MRHGFSQKTATGTRRATARLRLLPRLDRPAGRQRHSLDEQERKIAARCTEHGWQLEHVYVDAGVSGSTPLNKPRRAAGCSPPSPSSSEP